MLSAVSVAVTVTLVCVPAVAFVALMWITPLGLVFESVAWVMVILLVGEVPRPPERAVPVTSVMSCRILKPETSWPKIV